MKHRLLTLTILAASIQLPAQAPANLRIDSSYQRTREIAFIGFYYWHNAQAFDYDNFDSLAQRRVYQYPTEFPESPKYWEDRFRYFHSYFSQKKVVVEERAHDSAAWALYRRTTQTLNPANKPSEILNEFPDWNDSLRPVSRYLFTYNPADLVTERLLESWNKQTAGWEPNRQLLVQYDSMNREVFIQENDWDTDSLAWEVQRENIFLYNALGRKIEQIESRRLSDFRPRFKYTWTYNSLGLVDTFRDFTAVLPNSWNPRDQTTTAYDNQGEITLQHHYSGNSNGWYLRSKRVWYPNPATPGIPDSTTLYNWIVNAQEFKIQDREKYTFLQLPDNRFYYQYYKEEVYIGDWVESEVREIWYSKPKASPLPPEPARINSACQFPNPYAPGQNIQCANLESGQPYTARLFSLDGREVFNTGFQGNETWSINRHIPAGMYHLVIFEVQSAVSVQKVIVH